jgi:hypothetical protein
MMHKIDHPQYHPVKAATATRAAHKVRNGEGGAIGHRATTVAALRQEWRGGAKVHKR